MDITRPLDDGRDRRHLPMAPRALSGLRHRPAGRRPRSGGFSLIELMVAIAVAGLLATVAMPSFVDAVRKTRRSEAFAAMSAIQQAQERWRASHPSYTAAWADLAASSATPRGYYTLSISTPASPDDRIGYDLVATAARSQVEDTPCKRMAIELRRGRVRYGSGASAIDWTDTNRCWAP